MARSPEKIDVHAHFLPSVYREQCLANGYSSPDGYPNLPEWDLDAHLKMADEMNITKSYLSISSPGVHLVRGNDQLTRDLCRDCNIAGADIKKRYPERFGFFASLPLPDVGDSLKELSYVFDTLNADGIVVETNFHGYYLGHRSFEPIWAELNRRSAIVFIHPTTGCILKKDASSGEVCHKIDPLSEFPNPIFEFLFDTTRAVINLFYSGMIARYPNITYIVSHAGACLPPLIERFSLFGRRMPNVPVDESVTSAFVRERLRKQFYFDMAGVPWPDQLPALLPLIGKDQVLYGSDYPFTKSESVKSLGDMMEHFMPTVFTTEEEREMAYKRNAEKLFGTQSSGK
ncbi:hypothetical protein N7510_007897 [Penicillium lagena]|uniref:uncharacterized protein n=1 Tax=Penicillium lagena TaxID=94218 RepID=UPI002541602A|nr:uncharacterized protein N7510_007897 [Penicillium lagena]KAJ5611178.1 hypothetical protein N7510_007897 [Penicillium lagena]